MRTTMRGYGLVCRFPVVSLRALVKNFQCLRRPMLIGDSRNPHPRRPSRNLRQRKYEQKVLGIEDFRDAKAWIDDGVAVDQKPVGGVELRVIAPPGRFRL